MPKPTLWERKPHTEGKHLILRSYLDGWLPIMGAWNGRLLFIDGFAGPGRYVGGEEGSPMLALRAFAEHHAKTTITAEIVYVFIDADPRRVAHLEELVAELKPELPGNAKVVVEEGTFDGSLTEVLDALDEQGANLAPAFVMIDPFGVSDTPMSVIARILQNPRCEIYVSFMYESMNRFITTPEFAPHLDDLFGVPEWRQAIDLRGEERQAFLYDLYRNQLIASGAEHVVHIDLYDGNRLVYGIFFGTQHEKGCDLMKQAMWRVAPSGQYTFRGSRSGQLELTVDEPDFEPPKQQLCEEFGGRGWVAIEDITKFMASDRTEYHSGHLKKGALKPLEREGLLHVDETSRKRRWTYPKGTRIRFPDDGEGGFTTVHNA